MIGKIFFVVLVILGVVWFVSVFNFLQTVVDEGDVIRQNLVLAEEVCSVSNYPFMEEVNHGQGYVVCIDSDAEKKVFKLDGGLG